jgi:hypothetical protein
MLKSKIGLRCAMASKEYGNDRGALVSRHEISWRISGKLRKSVSKSPRNFVAKI